MAARRSVLRFAALLLSSLVVPAVASQPGALGVWHGTLERDGAPLEMELAFESRGDSLDGYFSSAALRAVRIPLSGVQFEPPRLRWQLKGDATTLVAEGSIEGDSLRGTFTEGAAAGTFRLRRAAGARFPAREKDISFPGGGGVALAGSMLRPEGAGPFPGVVFVQGSGAEGRWASRYLAHEFARSGIAALVYDKRGVGASQGDWREAGFEDLVKDASAAVDALRSQPDIDPRRVGIHGHSQGGTIAPWVAVANPNVAFVVASAASGVGMAATEIYSLDNALRVATLPPGERRLAERFVRALVAHANEGASREELEAVRREAQGRPWLIEVPPDSSFYWRFSRRIAGYDPLRYWRDVRVPALLVYGELDERVPAAESAKRIAAGAGTKPEVIVFPGADHGFRLERDRAKAFAWPETAPGYPQRVVDWVLRVTRR